jgi:peptidoglycan/LPS O-acetylase OafA/YrhL
MTPLRIFGASAITIGILAALAEFWAMRSRTDVVARARRYQLLGIISLCLVVPAGMFLEQRLAVVPWFALLVVLVGGGLWFLRKATHLER